MNLLYSCLVVLFVLVRLPRYLYQRVRRGRYRGVFSQRLGFLQSDVAADGETSPIWVHAVSVGEVNAVRPLLTALKERKPEISIVLSTVTDTGQEIARKLPEPRYTFYLPIDLRTCCRRTIRQVNPSLLILAETEIWPNLLAELDNRNVPVVLINGRLSDTSFPRYRRIRPLIGRVLRRIRLYLVQTEEDAERFREIGVPPERIEVTGNLKFDGVRVGEDLDLRTEWRDLLGISNRDILIVAGSTFEGEEEILIDVWKQLRSSYALRLLLAPRHPERFSVVEGLLKRTETPFALRSRIEQSAERPPVILLDTMGELSSVYAAADIAFLGKSLCGVGGQNPLEPACRGIPVVFGPRMENFRAAAQVLLDSGSAAQINDKGQLAAVLKDWIEQPDLRLRMGRNAMETLQKHTGVTERILNSLETKNLL